MKRFFLLVALWLFPLIAFSQNSSHLTDAQELFAAGDYNAAVTKFQEVVNTLSGRDRTIAQIQMGTAKACVEALSKAQAAVSAKNYDVAISEYQKVLDANPNDTRVKGLQEAARQLKMEEIIPTLTLSKSSLSFSSAGGSQKITVTSNTSWVMVDQSSSMCTVRRFGSEITVDCSVNSSSSSRSTSFIIKTANGAKEQRVSISQTGRSSTSPSSTSKLTVKPSSVSVPSGSGTTIVDVFANGKDYEVAHLPSWARVKTKYGTWFSLSYSENPYSTTRSDWFTVKAGGEMVTVSISQSGNSSKTSSYSTSSAAARLTVKQTNITLPSNSGTTRIDVSTNVKDYEVSLLPGWITLKSKYDTFFSLTYSENYYSSSRSDWFYVTAGGKTVRVDVTQRGKDSDVNSYGNNRKSRKNGQPKSNGTVFALGLDMNIDVFGSNNYRYYHRNESLATVGFGLRARLGSYNQLFNLIGGIRYVYGDRVSGLMAPALVNMNLIRMDNLSMYLGGGYEFSCLDTNSYYGDWMFQGGVCGPHADFQIYYKPTQKVYGAGFTFYF